MMLFDDFSSDPDMPIAPARPVRPGLHVLQVPLSSEARGVLLRLRGEGQSCRMILTTRAMGPHQGYEHWFIAPRDWTTLNLFLSDFRPFGGVLRRTPRPEALHGYAIEPAALQIGRVSFY